MDVDSKAESTNTMRRYRAPVSKKNVDPSSTVADNGVGGQQEATTRSNSAPKGRIGAPNPQVLHLNYMQASPHQRYMYPDKAEVPEASGSVKKSRKDFILQQHGPPRSIHHRREKDQGAFPCKTRRTHEADEVHRHRESPR